MPKGHRHRRQESRPDATSLTATPREVRLWPGLDLRDDGDRRAIAEPCIRRRLLHGLPLVQDLGNDVTDVKQDSASELLRREISRDLTGGAVPVPAGRGSRWGGRPRTAQPPRPVPGQESDSCRQDGPWENRSRTLTGASDEREFARADLRGGEPRQGWGLVDCREATQRLVPSGSR